jgi:hypothetical protein
MRHHQEGHSLKSQLSNKGKVLDSNVGLSAVRRDAKNVYSEIRSSADVI